MIEAALILFAMSGVFALVSIRLAYHKPKMRSKR